MQQFCKLTPKSRVAVRILTHALHNADECEGTLFFLPWDIIDDLQEYLGGISQVTTLFGAEFEFKFDSFEEISQYLSRIRSPDHLFLTSPSNELSIDKGFLRDMPHLTSLDTSGLHGVTSIGS
eukprot:PhF_6_TR40587/c2_g1_i1/m.60865